jgi:hypothetical protein
MENETDTSGWSPTFINIEKEFTKFVKGYRGGKLVSEVTRGNPASVLNADFFFEADNVVAELKCLVADAADSVKKVSRLVSSAIHFGYTGSDIFGWSFRNEEVPKEVLLRTFAMEKRPIVQAFEKADKQIRSTKSLLKCPKARGLVLIANDGNHQFSPAEMLSILCAAFAQFRDCHVDCVVYLTPNVYHTNGKDDIARSLWTPVYNIGSEDFGDFVNDIGRAWFDYFEKTGKPFLERVEAEGLDEMAQSRPITEFLR